MLFTYRFKIWNHFFFNSENSYKDKRQKKKQSNYHLKKKKKLKHKHKIISNSIDLKI